MEGLSLTKEEGTNQAGPYPSAFIQQTIETRAIQILVQDASIVANAGGKVRCEGNVTRERKGRLASQSWRDDVIGAGQNGQGPFKQSALSNQPPPPSIT